MGIAFRNAVLVRKNIAKIIIKKIKMLRTDCQSKRIGGWKEGRSKYVEYTTKHLGH